MESEDDEKILHWVLKDHGGIAYFGFAYYSTNSATLTVARIAEDQVKGVADTLDAKVEPNAYSITDGSYDNSAWERAHAYLAYGFTDAGQQAVANVGYVAPGHARALISSFLLISFLLGKESKIQKPPLRVSC
ncbi:unnamed protein product [Durusdinium trenchii]|uniref:Uncharacterized protein n=1 Tax=Durusdinium trenchii TaxID=1381693 RepID=A0ABP0J933_9DINO